MNDGGSKNRRQHFLPRHYLRQFCEVGDESIGVVRLDPLKIIERAGISRQCQESHFYRGSEGVDELLGLFEKDLSAILRRVASEKVMTTPEKTPNIAFSK